MVMFCVDFFYVDLKTAVCQLFFTLDMKLIMQVSYCLCLFDKI